MVWYAFFQTAHAGLNARYLASTGPLPFAPPPEGWLPQAVAFLNGAAVADLINAVLSVVFVAGFFRGARWAAWLGTLTLTVSNYAGLVFTLGIVQAGGWRLLRLEYLSYWGAFRETRALGIRTRSTRRLTPLSGNPLDGVE